MSIDHAVYARECLERWPEQRFREGSDSVTPRAACTTCRCYTIPVHLVHSADGECGIKAPGKYPCPVCGQCDQYIAVWIAARARHHAASQISLRERGYVTKRYGDLRAPSVDELPEPARESFTGFGNAGLAARVTTLTVNAGDVRMVIAPDTHAADLSCAACRSLIAPSLN
jgi:hypothetical protein